MSMIVTRCPRTSREIATGIYAEPDTFHLLPDVPSKIQCPVCGEDHLWRKSEAWLGPARVRLNPCDISGAA